ESLHDHLKKEFNASISIIRHKINDEIRKRSIPLSVKYKSIFNGVSQKIEFICPKYNAIKFQITRNINK
ncbi:hypothetical protein H8356DRAFT_962718, partial [Neocallimastix lanati (nom. inval.)]